MEEPLGAQENCNKVENTSNISESVSSPPTTPPRLPPPPRLSSFTNWKNSCRRSRMRKSARLRQAADQRATFPPTLKVGFLAARWRTGAFVCCTCRRTTNQNKKNQTDFLISAGRTMLRLQPRRGGAGAASTRGPTTRRRRHEPSPPQPLRFFTFFIDFSLWDSSHLSVFTPA